MSIRGYIPARVGAQLSSMRIAFKSVVVLAAVAITVALGLGTASASPAVVPLPNPPLPACGPNGLKVALVADLSEAVGQVGGGGDLTSLKTSASQYVDALAGSPTQMALFTFSTNAPANSSEDENRPLTSVQTQAGANVVKGWINGWTTNGAIMYQDRRWDRGLAQVVADSTTFDMVILLADSYPSAYDYVSAANAIKAKGTRIIVVLVDDSVKGEERAEAASGPVHNNPVLSKNDYFQTNRADLTTVLSQLASTCSVAHGLAVTVQYVDSDGTVIAGTTLYGQAGDPVGFTYEMAVAGAPPGYVVLSINNVETFADLGVPQVITVSVTAVLSFSDGFRIGPRLCGGGTAASPDHVTATLTVIDSLGNPVAGAPVDWSADSPFLLGTKDAVTGPDGTAHADVSYDATQGYFAILVGSDAPAVHARVAGIDYSATPAVANLPLPQLRFATGSMSVMPTSVFPVPADGVSSWTMMVYVSDQCGPVVGTTVSFFAGGSAVVSDAQQVTDSNGWARVRVTDTVAEQVPVSATGTFAMEVPVNGVETAFVQANDYANPPTGVMNLVLSGDTFQVDGELCGGQMVSYPNSLTATVTASNSSGHVMGGLPVQWFVDPPLLLSSPVGVTGPDGTAEVTVTPYTWLGVSDAVIRAEILGKSVTAVIHMVKTPNQSFMTPVEWTVTPDSLNGFPSVADGGHASAVGVRAVDPRCGAPIAGRPVSFSVDGSATMYGAAAETDQDGWAWVMVQDTVAETVTVSAVVSGVGAAPPVQVTFIDPPTAPGPYSFSPLLSSSAFEVFIWGTHTEVTPDQVTGRFLVADMDGNPVGGLPVVMWADLPLVIDRNVAVTTPDGYLMPVVTVDTSQLGSWSPVVHVSIDGVEWTVPIELVVVPGPTAAGPCEDEALPVVATPVFGSSSGGVVSGTVLAAPGESVPVSVQVTYLSSGHGPLTVEAAVRDGQWSVALPDDAVSGELILVARDAADNASVPVTAQYDQAGETPAEQGDATVGDQGPSDQDQPQGGGTVDQRHQGGTPGGKWWLPVIGLMGLLSVVMRRM